MNPSFIQGFSNRRHRDGSAKLQPEPLPQKARNTLFVVVSDDGRGGGLDGVVGVGRRVALVGHLEHAQVVVVVTEADDTLDTQQFLHDLDGAAFAGVAVVHIQPAPLPAFPGDTGIGHQVSARH